MFCLMYKYEKVVTLINLMYMKVRTILIQPDPKISNNIYQISFDHKIGIIKNTFYAK